MSDERKTQDKFIPFVIAIVFFCRRLLLFSLSCFLSFAILMLLRGVAKTVFVTYCFVVRSSILVFFCALFMLLHLFTFRIPFDFSIFHVYPTSSTLIFFSFYLFSFFGCHHCMCSTFCDAMQSVSDLEIPSISFNWTHIQKLSTRQPKCLLSSTESISINLMVKVRRSREEKKALLLFA